VFNAIDPATVPSDSDIEALLRQDVADSTPGEERMAAVQTLGLWLNHIRHPRPVPPGSALPDDDPPTLD
jgi:hypothetical protein